MKLFLCILFLVLCSDAYCYSEIDSLILKLKYEFGRQAFYDQQKENRIISLKNNLQGVDVKNIDKQFDLCLKLYDEYKSYKYDSAYVYAARLNTISRKAHNSIKENYSKVKLGFILLSAGKYKDAFTIIDKIDHRGFNEFALEDYYSVMIRANTDLADYDNDQIYSPGYKTKANLYLDSAIQLSNKDSYSQLFLVGYRNFINGKNDVALKDFLELYGKYTAATHENAIAGSLLSELYLRTNQPEKAKAYLIKAVIADLQASTKETLAIFRLAELTSKNGDNQNAYIYIHQALKNAEFYGARQRQVQISSLLPLIAAQKLNFIESQKKRFLIYLCSTLTLSLIIIIISFLWLMLIKNLLKMHI